VNLGASHLPQSIEAADAAEDGGAAASRSTEYELQRQQTLAKAKVAEARATRKRAREGEGASGGEPSPARDAEPLLVQSKAIEPRGRHPAAVLRERHGCRS